MYNLVRPALFKNELGPRKHEHFKCGAMSYWIHVVGRAHGSDTIFRFSMYFLEFFTCPSVMSCRVHVGLFVVRAT